jgi:uncharacterized transporter YbjL
VIRLRQDGSAAPQAGGAATRRRDCLWLLVIGITVVAVVRVLIVLGVTVGGVLGGIVGSIIATPVLAAAAAPSATCASGTPTARAHLSP